MTISEINPLEEVTSGMEIQRLVGEGSSGEIYLALWQETPVCLKKIKGKDEKQLREFKQEAAILWYVRDSFVVDLSDLILIAN